MLETSEWDPGNRSSNNAEGAERMFERRLNASSMFGWMLV